MSTATWVPPLPPNYEARWDPNSRAYFYINHIDKSTTWQDPRYIAGGAPATHTQAAQYLNSQGGGAIGTTQGQNVQMNTHYKQFGSTVTTGDLSDDEDWHSDASLPQFGAREEEKIDLVKVHKLRIMHPSASESVIKQQLKRNNNNLELTSRKLVILGHEKESDPSHPLPQGKAKIERLVAMYPDADPALVTDILEAGNFDEKSARTQLESIGYHPKSSTKAAKPDHRPHSSKQKKQTSVSPSPKKPSLTENQKRQLERKMKVKHPKMEDSVITMALQVCDYDESRIGALLERMNNDDSAGTGAGSRPSTSQTTRSRSPSPIPATLSPISLEPVSMFDDENNRPTSSQTGNGKARPGTAKSSSSSRPSTSQTSRVTSPIKSPTPKPSTGQREQHRAKQVTHGARSPARSVVARQPEGMASENRTQARGPDEFLRTGPNKNLLLTDYALAKGPNPDLRQGPMGNVMGSQGAEGPDSSIVNGPQFHLRVGASSTAGPLETHI